MLMKQLVRGNMKEEIRRNKSNEKGITNNTIASPARSQTQISQPFLTKTPPYTLESPETLPKMLPHNTKSPEKEKTPQFHPEIAKLPQFSGKTNAPLFSQPLNIHFEPHLNDVNCTRNDVIEPIDRFIDDLIEGRETILKDVDVVTTTKILRWEYESRNLPTIELKRFDGSHRFWPEFIENFKTRVHIKVSFDDNTRMERLVSVLDGEAKKAVYSIGTSGIFYATALKTLKRDFGNPVVVSHLKLKAVLDLPQLPWNDRISLRRYHQELNTTITWLSSMGYHSAIESTENLVKAVSRLPHYLRNQFYKKSTDKIFTNGGLNLKDFERWLNMKLKEHFNPIASLIATTEKSPPKQHHNLSKNQPQIKIRTMLNRKTELKCWICNDDHKVFNCQNFIASNIEERRKLVAEKGLCFNCLSNSHKIANCKSNKHCKTENCGKRHHTLLHKDTIIDNQTEKNVITNRLKEDCMTLLQIVPVSVFNGDQFVHTNAILDSGSDTTLIRSDIAQRLNLNGEERTLNISNVLADKRRIISKRVSFQISPSQKQNLEEIKDAWVVEELNVPYHRRNVSKLKEKYKHLKDVDLPQLNSDDVTILIGLDAPKLHIQVNSRIGNKNEPIAIETFLGWTVMGGRQSSLGNSTSINLLLAEKRQTAELSSILERFWEIESYPTASKLHNSTNTR